MDWSKPNFVTFEPANGENLRRYHREQAERELIRFELSGLISIGKTPATSSPPDSQAAKQLQQARSFQEIGTGSCGVVFALQGTSLVLKLGRSEDSNLWNDYLQHRLIYDCISKHNIGVKVPVCHFYVPKDDPIYFKQHEGLLDAATNICPFPTNVLVSERIHPLPERTRDLLIERCRASPRAKEEARAISDNQDCLVRMFLGSTFEREDDTWYYARPPLLRNFQLHLGRMVMLELDIEAIAREFAKAMAILHWEAKIDARGVEFVLGTTSMQASLPLSKTTSELRTLDRDIYTGPDSRFEADIFGWNNQLWLLDFDQVSDIPMDDYGVDLAVDAIMVNDPAYLDKSKKILKKQDPSVKRLPRAVIDGIIKEHKFKLGLIY
ncbi:zinc finger protein-domain-containing protein [Xylaria sp. CBS 124048]|nr:zinc finger protein-domain-containing protein [Xylaria sp. CBS 124048]